MNIDNKHIYHIGLLAAMPEELGEIKKHLKNIDNVKYGDLEIFSGIYFENEFIQINLSAAWSGWGKVSSARATTRLISKIYLDRKIDFLIFTGVAGAIEKNLKQWDVIISESVIQHDINAEPIFEKFTIPALNKKQIYPKSYLIDLFYHSLFKKFKNGNLKNFKNIYKGLIATGDCFISDKDKISTLIREIPTLLAVEMEGGSFAQVAEQENIDWIIIRVISDSADNNAQNDFNKFLELYKIHSWELVKSVLDALIQKNN